MGKLSRSRSPSETLAQAIELKPAQTFIMDGMPSTVESLTHSIANKIDTRKIINKFLDENEMQS